MDIVFYYRISDEYGSVLTEQEFWDMYDNWAPNAYDYVEEN